jgi:transposase-like protein
MGTQRQVFSKEFKIEAVRLSQTSGKSDRDIGTPASVSSA